MGREALPALFFKPALDTQQIRRISPPTVLAVEDPSAGLKGWLAVDSVIDRHCCGGLRMLPHVSAVELVELAGLMTLKHAFLGLPHGGAKAGIIYEEHASPKGKAALLAVFARNIRDLLLSRFYVPGADMGTNGRDIRRMLESAGIPLPKRVLLGTNSGWYTALTVIASLKAAAAIRGCPLKNATVAIEGFGAVGSALAQELQGLGCKIVAISTQYGAIHAPDGLEVSELMERRQRHGDRLVEFVEGARRIPRESLLELDVTILAPCAGSHSIHVGNAGNVTADLIGCGANAPITRDAEEILSKKGKLCVPDFVANAGGVLGGTMEFAGIPPADIKDFMDRYYTARVKSLIQSACEESMGLREKAEKTAMERMKRMQSSAGKHPVRDSAFHLGLHLYRTGRIPQMMIRRLAWKYFKKRLCGNV